jgi:hypothetical protein
VLVTAGGWRRRHRRQTLAPGAAGACGWSRGGAHTEGMCACSHAYRCAWHACALLLLLHPPALSLARSLACSLSLSPAFILLRAACVRTWFVHCYMRAPQTQACTRSIHAHTVRGQDGSRQARLRGVVRGTCPPVCLCVCISACAGTVPSAPCMSMPMCVGCVSLYVSVSLSLCGHACGCACGHVRVCACVRACTCVCVCVCVRDPCQRVRTRARSAGGNVFRRLYFAHRRLGTVRNWQIALFRCRIRHLLDRYRGAHSLARGA